MLTARSWTASASILAKWIALAELSLNTYGDLFSFSAISSALQNEDLANLEKLWLLLEEHHPKEFVLLQSMLTECKNLNKAHLPEHCSVSVPNIIPFLSGCRDLKSLSVFTIAFEDIFKDSSNNFEDHVNFVTSVLISNLPQFEANGKKFMTEEHDQQVKSLFETEFHLRLLWGSSGSTIDIDSRHAKFEKVIHALARLVKNLS